MRIHLPDHIYDQLLTYGLQQMPDEACGALIGIHQSMCIEIMQFVPLSNVALNRKSEFRLDEHEWSRLLFNGLASDQQLVGLIHSHPTAAAIPSVTDLSTLWHTIPTHWIISLLDMNNPVLKAYAFHKDGTYVQIDWSFKA